MVGMDGVLSVPLSHAFRVGAVMRVMYIIWN